MFYLRLRYCMLKSWRLRSRPASSPWIARRSYMGLYSQEISQNYDENTAIRKTIANISFGLLEKSCNKSKISKMFDSLRERRSHQSDQGGTISVIEQQQVEKNFSKLGCKFAYKNTGRKVFVLTKTETTKLCDGFRYIKELLLQLHNLAMQEAYDKLSRNGITVFSVKTDCFTIRPEDLEKANSCLDIFYPDPITGGAPAIGQWRVSKTKHIILPTSSLQKLEKQVY